MKKITLFWIGVLLLTALFFYLLRGIMLPFVMSFILAYILNPLVQKLVAHKWNRMVATLVVIVGLIVSILLSILIIVPVLEAQVVSFVRKIPTYANAPWLRVQPLFDYVKEYIHENQLANIKEALSQQSMSFVNELGNTLMNLFSQGAVLFDIVSFMIITPVVTFYLLADWEVIVAKIKKLFPRRNAPFIEEKMAELDMTLSAFVRGQAIVCLFLALFYGIGLSVIGIDLGFGIGFISGLLSFIPYVGSLTGFFLSLLMAFTQSAEWSLLIGILLVFGIGQFFEGYVLTPKLVGDKVGLHPAWVIFALFAGGSLFGFLGVLLAVPVAAMLGVLIRTAVGFYQNSSFYKAKK